MAAQDLIKWSPSLQEIGFDFRRDVRPSTYTIHYRPLGCYYQAIATESGGNHGEFPRTLLIDELHAHRDRRPIDTIREGMSPWGSDRLTLFITNMAASDDLGPFWAEYKYAKECLEDPSYDPGYYVDIREPTADLTDDELLEEGPHWYDIQPALGDLVPLEFYRQSAAEAKRKPSQRSDILRFHFCRTTRSDKQAIDLKAWDKCADPTLTDLELMGGQPVMLGLDLSSRWDLTAITLQHVDHANTQTWYCWPFVPADNVDGITERTGQPIAQWIEDGHLLTTEGAEINFDEIAAFLERLCANFNVQAIAYDPRFATQLAQQLANKELPMLEFTPGFTTYNEPFQRLETAIPAGRLRHNGSPVLRYAAASLAVRTDPEMRSKPVKIDRRRDARRIDPIVAGLMADYAHLTAPPRLPFARVTDMR